MVDLNGKRLLIWGTGGYCAEKIEYIEKIASIIGFIERKEVIFRNTKTITPDRIFDMDFEYIVILSSAYFEIAKELLVYGVKADRIIPGVAVAPHLFSEVDLVIKDADIEVGDNGELIYSVLDKTYIIENYSDWEKIREIVLDKTNVSYIQALSCRPVSKKWGLDRGGSIVRYYLEDFFEKNKEFIHGKVLEIGDRNYTIKYGKQVESYVLHYASDQSTEFEIYGDLVTGEGLQDDFYDCIILTQVLAFVSDVFAVIKNVSRALKKDGHILVTDCGLSPLGRYEKERFGHFWSFTKMSYEYMFNECFFESSIICYGNAKVACGFLMGMSCVDFDKQDLDYFDEDYQLVVAANISRKRSGL